MFLPFGDTPNPPTTPYVNYFFIAANISVFIFFTLPLSLSRPDLGNPLLLDYLQIMTARSNLSPEQLLQNVTAYDLFIFRYGFRPASASIATLFTSMFLHGGWLHLAGNMLFLWIFGDNVEHRLGKLGYLLAYLLAGIAATLFFALFVPGSQIPLVGASGAISGVLGFYFLWFPRNKVKTFVFLFPLIMNTFYLPARLVLGFYLVVDNVIPFLINAGQGAGVAHGAHIGGFGAGILLAFGVDRWRLASHGLRGYLSPGKASAKGKETAEVDRIIELLGEKQLSRASELYLNVSEPQARLAVPDEGVLTIADFLLNQGRHLQALSLFRRFIAERPASPEIGRAYLGAGFASLRQPRGETSAQQYFLAAIDTSNDEATTSMARDSLRRLREGNPL